MTLPKKGRVFSGARPTGRQHLGNYLGAIQNYVALQDEYDCVYCIVDLHALTTVEETANLRQNTYEMALDWLAAGIRPVETIMFVQSHVSEVTELHTILSMVAQLGKLTDLPTFKEKVRQQPQNVNVYSSPSMSQLARRIQLKGCRDRPWSRQPTRRHRRSDPKPSRRSHRRRLPSPLF